METSASAGASPAWPAQPPTTSPTGEQRDQHSTNSHHHSSKGNAAAAAAAVSDAPLFCSHKNQEMTPALMDKVLSEMSASLPTSTSSSSLGSLDKLQPLAEPLTLRHRRRRSFSDMDRMQDSSQSHDGGVLEEKIIPFQIDLGKPYALQRPTQKQQQQQPRPQRAVRAHPSRAKFMTSRRSKRTRWLIPADHPCKIAWDLLTILLSFLGAYYTHSAIRDRSFGRSPFYLFCEAWFAIDILLNFVTEHKTSQGVVIRDGRSIWARYLTTWFVIDALSLLPWESFYVKPIIEMQKRRGFFKKSFFRTRAVVRVTRVLRGRHFRLFGKVARQTKHAGVGARRLLRLLIKYVPKYLLFFRNMKAALAVRTLRQLHWMHKIIKNFRSSSSVMKPDDETESLTTAADVGEDYGWYEDDLSFATEYEFAYEDEDGTPY